MDAMARTIEGIRKKHKATSLIVGIEFACELKRHEKFIQYSEITPTCIKLFDLRMIEDSSIPKDAIIVRGIDRIVDDSVK